MLNLELYLKHAILQSDQAVIFVDEKQQIRFVNPSAEKLFGYLPGELTSKHLLNLIPRDTFEKDYVPPLTDFKGEKSRIRKDGSRIPVHITVSCIKDDDGNPIGQVVTYLDITECKRKEERLVRLAYHDELTQLPNRRLLQDRLSYAIERQDRTEKTGALLFVDIDHFKDVNDIYGHDVGDLLLKEVAVRLTSCIRKSDTAARIGGDEFIIVLIEDLGLDNKNVVKIAEKIRESIEKPFYIENNTLTITVSIGVTLFHKDCTVDELLKRSDNALYKAKQAGRNIIEFYQPNEEEINNA